MSNSAISQLKKAHQAMAITKSDYSLQDFLAKYKNPGSGIARMALTGLKSKYVGKYDKSNSPDGGSLGFRTEFTILNPDGKTGSKTVATFSNAAHDFYRLYAMFKGWNPEDKSPVPQIIEIVGHVTVEISSIPLDGGKSTYNFNIVEEDSKLDGLGGYVPDTSLLLPSGETLNIESGEILPAEQPEAATSTKTK